ncbi:PKD domain-containing protein [Winogradskyella psychrotolerans]|uniref:PKD domain-containing protein n=1 Tax=Winogradskyella psychrotolerans TaxID=1344585 RepID=UPI001C07B6E5|nr:PKD domain-containing protein [Winogradskyella psychrotolerans]MBU2927973.1 PKD domain-containing protein [Winogradskyella psychrotolerans]
MKTINKFKIRVSQKLMATLLFVVSVVIVSCDPTIDALAYDLPDANSKEDLTPPSAEFTASVTADYLTYTFANESISATSYLWNYGDGNSSTDLDGMNTFPDEGTYTVTLTATDDLGVSSSYTEEIEVVEPEVPPTLIPVILEAGFDNGNDSRDPWRNSDLGGVIQITSSNGYHEGSNAAKLPPSGDRIGYQLIGEFTPDTLYELKFKYTFRDQDDASNGSLTVAMVQAMSSIDQLEDNTISSITFTEDVAGVGSLVSGSLIFDSGGNTSLAIFFYNNLDEAYIDSFEIEALE